MSTAPKIGEMVRTPLALADGVTGNVSQLVGMVGDRLSEVSDRLSDLADRLPDVDLSPPALPAVAAELPARLKDLHIPDRLREAQDAGARVAGKAGRTVSFRRVAIPLAVIAVVAGAGLLIRSRRSRTEVGVPERADSFSRA